MFECRILAGAKHKHFMKAECFCYGIIWLSMTVKKLFLTTLVVLVLSIGFTNVMNNPNQISYSCVPNIDQKAFNAQKYLFGSNQNPSDQIQRFCPQNQHPELTEKWETINRYISYSAYIICIPILLCSFVKLRSRHLKSYLTKKHTPRTKT